MELNQPRQFDEHDKERKEHHIHHAPSPRKFDHPVRPRPVMMLEVSKPTQLEQGYELDHRQDYRKQEE
jgi:hypothetical protein